MSDVIFSPRPRGPMVDKRGEASPMWLRFFDNLVATLNATNTAATGPAGTFTASYALSATNSQRVSRETLGADYGATTTAPVFADYGNGNGNPTLARYN